LRLGTLYGTPNAAGDHSALEADKEHLTPPTRSLNPQLHFLPQTASLTPPTAPGL